MKKLINDLSNKWYDYDYEEWYIYIDKDFDIEEIDEEFEHIKVKDYINGDFEIKSENPEEIEKRKRMHID